MSTTTTTTVKPLPVPSDINVKITYDNYQVWRLMPSTDEHLRFLKEYRLSADGERLQWWKGPTLRLKN